MTKRPRRPASTFERLVRRLAALRKRARELECLYRIEAFFSDPNTTIEQLLHNLVDQIPQGWQYPQICTARIKVDKLDGVESKDFSITAWCQEEVLTVAGKRVGEIIVSYREERPSCEEGPFLRAERKLLQTIASRLVRRLQHAQVILDLLRHTDTQLLARISEKMLVDLDDRQDSRASKINNARDATRSTDARNDHLPRARTTEYDLVEKSKEIFAIAASAYPEQEILQKLERWIKEDRSGSILRIVDNPASSFAEIAQAADRYQYLEREGVVLVGPRERAFRASLIRRLLSDQPAFILTARQFFGVQDLRKLLERVIHRDNSQGTLGGKAAGLLLAKQILEASEQEFPLLREVRIPKTWFLTSDFIYSVTASNGMEELIEIKYDDVAHVRQIYPEIIQAFKKIPLPLDIQRSLEDVLRDLGGAPLIVRSSSLLEDRPGTSFAGKYRSLFLANRGRFDDRVKSLWEAIMEVFASTFGPDPIEYRSQHGLLDFNEEMGVIVQQVVGRGAGPYFFPSFAGVAFSHNEYQWSPRIQRKDGLIRMVPGLGTRAVDRQSDDYPILVSPGQPSVRVNATLSAKLNYSPRMMDVINRERGDRLETVSIHDVLARTGADYPRLHELVSILRDGRLEQPAGLGFDVARDQVVMTFDGLIERSSVVAQIRTMLEVLRAKLGTPVDIEFAHDGTNLYLLQCRAQSYTSEGKAVNIPGDIPKDRFFFTANRYVPNAIVPEITHVVYVDPKFYRPLSEADMIRVGQAISNLNRSLQRRRFILIGPGRWGSRGDIRLGVHVTYSDIKNTAMLIEVATRGVDFDPEPSFGTHFFQDLVEESIRYLPLYPDEKDVVFNEQFLGAAENQLPALLPEFASLQSVIRVVDISKATDGGTLEIYMDGESQNAVAFFSR